MNDKLSIYIETDYGKKLDKELSTLVNQERITLHQKDLVLRVKSKEYFVYCIENNHVWDSVAYYLRNLPEIFSIHDLLLIEEPVQKAFFIINSIADKEFEKILEYQKLKYNKFSKNLNDNRSISIYVIYLKYPARYTLKNNPVRKTWSIAEDSGIRVGHHTYSDPKEKNSFIHLGLLRNFPLQADNFGDYSNAAGGFRNDLKAGFKSSWEANIARLFNKNRLNWEYERSSPDYLTEIGYYIPDFFVEKGNKHYIVEVKGFWDERSIKKVSTVKRKVVDEVVIIDTDFYSLIDKKYKHSIPNWEETGGFDSLYTIPVIGITYANRAEVIENLSEGDSLILIREPENQFDSNAIKVVTKDNHEIGFVAKDWASIFSYKIDCGFTYTAYLYRKELSKKRIMIRLKTNPAPESLLGNIPFL